MEDLNLQLNFSLAQIRMVSPVIIFLILRFVVLVRGQDKPATDPKEILSAWIQAINSFETSINII
jgi:hypothetical protein